MLVVSILGRFFTNFAGLAAFALLAGLKAHAFLALQAALAVVTLLKPGDKRVILGEHNNDGNCGNGISSGVLAREYNEPTHCYDHGQA